MRGSTVPPWSPGATWRRPSGGVPTSEMRVSDAERRVMVDALSQHFADGRLDQSEFDERMEAALGAKTRGDLDGLLRDLPPLDDAVKHPTSPRRRRSGRTLVLLGVFALWLVVSSWSWAWHWQGLWWGWRSHLHVPVLLVLAVILLVRRRRWHGHLQARDTAP